MIKNERQYRITRTQAERFARTLEGLREEADGIHPVIAQAWRQSGTSGQEIGSYSRSLGQLFRVIRPL